MKPLVLLHLAGKIGPKPAGTAGTFVVWCDKFNMATRKSTSSFNPYIPKAQYMLQKSIELKTRINQGHCLLLVILDKLLSTVYQQPLENV